VSISMSSAGLVLLMSVAMAGNVYAGDAKNDGPKEENKCVGAGPQAPRDIDLFAGSNPVQFSVAPPPSFLNLCNIHFHRNAEHKAAAFSTYVEDGEHSGWACKEPAAGRLEMKEAEYNGCDGIAPGDTIEVHWVYTSCNIKAAGVTPMGGGLSACMTTTCSNPDLRVVAQVFLLEKGGEEKFSTSPPAHSDPTVIYIGSTTGTSYSNTNCSPLQGTWDVKTTCSNLDIDDFSKWCRENEYKDHHAHGVRELVTSEALLSKIAD
jgi:hypothetical protein